MRYAITLLCVLLVQNVALAQESSISSIDQDEFNKEWSEVSVEYPNVSAAFVSLQRTCFATPEFEFRGFIPANGVLLDPCFVCLYSPFTVIDLEAARGLSVNAAVFRDFTRRANCIDQSTECLSLEGPQGCSENATKFDACMGATEPDPEPFRDCSAICESR
jgi:hypothetical protein